MDQGVCGECAPVSPRPAVWLDFASSWWRSPAAGQPGVRASPCGRRGGKFKIFLLAPRVEGRPWPSTCSTESETVPDLFPTQHLKGHVLSVYADKPAKVSSQCARRLGAAPNAWSAGHGA
jgi:hypothetical protein